MVLNKSQIQNGIKSKKVVVIPSLITEDSNGEVEIRPISSREWANAEETESKAFGKINTGNLNVDPHASKKKMEQQVMQNMNLDMDLAKMNTAEYNAKVNVVALGLSVEGGEKWTVKEVEDILPTPLTEIYEEILKLSGIPLDASQAKQFKNELESFPENRTGETDSVQ